MTNPKIIGISQHKSSSQNQCTVKKFKAIHDDINNKTFLDKEQRNLRLYLNMLFAERERDRDCWQISNDHNHKDEILMKSSPNASFKNKKTKPFKHQHVMHYQ